MVELGADLAIVFPGGRGTADCARRIRAAGIEIHEVRQIAA
jgi:predicted Rossmann-fold nucleotide-binding protein